MSKLAPNYYAEVIRWAESRPEPQCEQDVPYWVQQLDAILVRYCGATGRPCVEAAWRVDPEYLAAEGRFAGRCNHRTAAAVWAAAVGEFRRVAEAAMAEQKEPVG